MKKLIDGLQKFQTGYFKAHRELFEELAQGQHPRVLFITCSDSRIDPNLMTQLEVGEIFVIRNAGNIIPPYGATNGGEGASIEYAIEALNIEQVIICGHSHCGAMKGLLKIDALEEKMPQVYQWLRQAEATRRLIKENYQHLEGEDLLNITIEQNILTQLENIQTYPVVRSRLHQGRLSIHGWFYELETGTVLAYDPIIHEFIPPYSHLSSVQPEYTLHPSCPLNNHYNFVVTQEKTGLEADLKTASNGNGFNHLPLEQVERIYRGTR
jgi:carbonic anhydrase